MITGPVRTALIALLSSREGVDPAAFTTAYLAGLQVAADMQGFDVSDMVGAQEALLDPVAGFIRLESQYRPRITETLPLERIAGALCGGWTA